MRCAYKVCIRFVVKLQQFNPGRIRVPGAFLLSIAPNLEQNTRNVSRTKRAEQPADSSPPAPRWIFPDRPVCSSACSARSAGSPVAPRSLIQKTENLGCCLLVLVPVVVLFLRCYGENLGGRCCLCCSRGGELVLPNRSAGEGRCPALA